MKSIDQVIDELPHDQLLRGFVRSALAAERERCAKIADHPRLWELPPGGYSHFPANAIHREAGTAIAAAIRKG